MSRIHEQSKILQILSETPLVSLACKKIGLSRATYYRWYKDNKKFRDSADQILDIGRKNINDLAEQSLIKELARGNMNAIRFWLQHNDRRYVPVRTTYVSPENHFHRLNIGEVCSTCGYREKDPNELTLIANHSDELKEIETVKKMSRKELHKKILEKKAILPSKELTQYMNELYKRNNPSGYDL